MRKFVIEEEGHAEVIGEFESFSEAILELKKISKTPWNTEPNISPCTNPNCSRDYMLIEYEVSNKQWKIIKNDFALSVEPLSVKWHSGFENL